MIKKIVLIISLCLTATLLTADVWMSSAHSLLCDETIYYRCIDLIGNIWFGALIIIPIFPLSLITYFLHEKVFRAWIRFTYWWVPLSFAVVLFSSSRSAANVMGISDQAIFGIIAWGLYILISLIIITYKYFATRGK